jgi:hypothetical protein
MEAMKKQFYNVYGKSINEDILRTQDSTSTSSSLVVTKDKYNKIVQALQLYPTTKKRDQFMKNCFNRFSLGSNLEDNCLFRKVVIKPTNGSNDSPSIKLRKVIWYEKFFDVIHEAHISVSHSIYSRTHKVLIDSNWWGMPENAMKVYISLCPECLSTSRPPVAETLNPLKMIISNTIGKRAQMDLIDYRRRACLGYRWILRLVDHHSGFAHVAPLKRKTAKQTGRALVKILSSACIPEILQSDNGSEFLGKCIYYVKEFFKTINIIKGRPRRPNEQGSVERGNADFKKALLKWEQEYPDEKWPLVGIYVVNKNINTRPAQNKANRSAYEVYYGKVASATTGYILSSELLKSATTEYAISSIQDLMDVIQLKDPNVLIPLDVMHALIRDADTVYELEARLREDAMRTKDYDDYEQLDVDKKLQEIVHLYADKVMERAAEQAAVDDSKPAAVSPLIKVEGRPSRQRVPRKVFTMTEDSPCRKRIRLEVKEAKEKQAEKVNALRRKKVGALQRKEILDVGDICTVSTQFLKKTYFPYLPVMITAVNTKPGDVNVYNVASKHGYIRGTFMRDDLIHHKNYTAQILNYSTEVEGFKKNLSLQKACDELALGTSCNCSGDCSKNARCSCKAAGTFCTSLCHSGRGKNRKCTLLEDLCCSEPDDDVEE